MPGLQFFTLLCLLRVRHPDGSNACPGGVTMCTLLPGYSMAMMCQPQLHQGQLAPTPLPHSCCQTEGDPSLCRVEVWHLLLMDPVLSLSHTSENSTGGCKINTVYNMQPYMMQRWCIGNQVLSLSPFTS